MNNAVKVYNDCSELYWQFIGKDFDIDIDIAVDGEMKKSEFSAESEAKIEKEKKN